MRMSPFPSSACGEGGASTPGGVRHFISNPTTFHLDGANIQAYVPVMFTSAKQAWDDAVVRNSQALASIAAQLLAFLAVYGGVDVARLPRAVHSRIIGVLRPAESALRRLIVIAARDVTVEPAPPRVQHVRDRNSPRKPASRMSFKLFDSRKRFSTKHVTYATKTPRAYFIAPDAPFSPLSPQPHSPPDRPMIQVTSDRGIGARRLCLRLKALASALDNIPRQAQRLARLRLRREKRQPPRLFSPLRPGNPPGHRITHHHEIDDILAECHKFALGVLSEPQPDTS